MRRLLTTPFVLAGVLGTAILHAQTITVSYDAFMNQNIGARHAQFPNLTPENQAAIMREQVIRWQRAHADQLTPEQDQLLGEIAAFIRPAFYGSSPHDEETKRTFMSLEQRMSRTFSRAESRDLTTIDGPYLPAQP
jgi:hypothetical protein